MSASPVSDYTGAAALPGSLPKAEWLLAYQGYDADCLREARGKEDKPCIPGRSSRKETAKYDKWRYKRRNRIEIMSREAPGLAPRRPSIRPLSRAHFSAIALAATVLFWL